MSESKYFGYCSNCEEAREIAKTDTICVKCGNDLTIRELKPTPSYKFYTKEVKEALSASTIKFASRDSDG